ncbi:VQ motif containing protein [Parasponia andersonii]|uniref:VQ motif containing protein n=1 Tax=Parasponia andersonii TaxID=3476 RepID=A0A2P5BBD6_PARAD|nr:VQ motif containing protein [Parasponia andersonii]
MENSLKRQKPNKAKKKPIKIKYISSPMMVQAKNASEFRAIVQQLTGKNSDLYEDEFHTSQSYDMNVTTLGEFDAPPAAAVSCWFPTQEDQLEADDDHDYHLVLQGDHHMVTEINHLDENFSISTTSTTSDHDHELPFLAQFDDQAHFWRSDVVLSENSALGEFQSPCVFVG